jgi:hypothetical protein
MAARPESEFPPSGCRWCGLDRRLHFQRWTDAAGWHKWEHPTQEQFKARMLERRSKAIEARAAMDAPAWDDLDNVHSCAMRWSPDDEVETLP